MPASEINVQKPIRVKFIGTYRVRPWQRQFPHGVPVWGNCEFIFDFAVKDYDWLVVYNDLPSGNREETLPCPRQQTILVTTEPSSIKAYGTSFTSQFGYVLTSQPEWALPHANRIFSQPALQWYYGLGRQTLRTYDQMVAEPPLAKSKVLSTVCSTKRQRHTLHNQRYDFTQKVKAALPIMDIFGHGVKEMDDKAEALDDYRYHLAIENFIGPHHWTEKLSDVFLGCALPFYCGCPNAADYFPTESFVPLNIYDVEGAVEIISRTIRDREYEKRLPYILESRRRVFEQYNMFSVLSREIEARTSPGALPVGGEVLSRHLMRRRHPLIAMSDFYEKVRSRFLHASKYQ